MNKPLAFELRSYVKQVVIASASEGHEAPEEVIFDVTALLPCIARRFAKVPTPEFDYSLLITAVDKACSSVQNRMSQEALALDVASRIFQGSTLVEEVEVQTRKTQWSKGAASVGCRISLTRIQWAALQSQLIRAL